MDRIIIPLPAPPSLRHGWAFVRTENGRMYYRSRNGWVYFQKLRTRRWYRVQNQTKEKR